MENTVGKSIMDFDFTQVIDTCKSFLHRWIEYRGKNEGKNRLKVEKMLSESCVELENTILTLKPEDLTVEKRNKIRLFLKETEQNIILIFH